MVSVPAQLRWVVEEEEAGVAESLWLMVGSSVPVAGLLPLFGCGFGTGDLSCGVSTSIQILGSIGRAIQPAWKGQE